MTQQTSTQAPPPVMPPPLVDGTGRMSPGIEPSVAALDALGKLPGTWTGTGFNVIWRPHFAPDRAQQHFLQLNLTFEHLVFDSIGGLVPNRGLVQPDINLTGLRYLQQIHDGSGFTPPAGGGALHIEPGFWLSVPPTEDPAAGASIVRLGSIPHGNAVLAQGTSAELSGAPPIQPASITPFVIGDPSQQVPFPESDLSTPSHQRTDPLPAGIDQDLVNNPNKLLTDRLNGQNVVHTTTLFIDTKTQPAGIENIPFLAPNAEAVDLQAIFWIETIAEDDGSTFLQLQYTQTLMLNFNGLSWPHVSVANLILTGA